MLSVLATLVVLGASLLGCNSKWIACLGLIAQRHGWRNISGILRRCYAAADTAHSQLWGTPSSSEYDKIARACWSSEASQRCRDWLVLKRSDEVHFDGVAAEKLIELRQRVGATDWAALGFQGSDPSTDFRAVGMLGLELLREQAEVIDLLNLLDESGSRGQTDPALPWYPVALVSIRLSMALTRALESDPSLIFKQFGTSKPLEQMKISIGPLSARLLQEFHNKWKAGVKSGQIHNYFDNEAVLRDFEGSLPSKLWGTVEGRPDTDTQRTML